MTEATQTNHMTGQGQGQGASPKPKQGFQVNLTIAQGRKITKQLRLDA